MQPDPSTLHPSLAPGKPVVRVSLSRTDLTYEGFRELAALKNLTALDLGYTELTDVKLRELAALKNLTALDMSSNRSDCDAALSIAVRSDRVGRPLDGSRWPAWRPSFVTGQVFVVDGAAA